MPSNAGRTGSGRSEACGPQAGAQLPRCWEGVIVSDGTILFSGSIFSVERVPAARGRDWQVVRNRKAAAVVATVADRVVLVDQFRPAVGRRLLELPAGHVDSGEIPLAAAKRELAEETGFSGGEWSLTARILTSPGFCDEEVFLFRAVDPSAGLPHPDQSEQLAVHLLQRSTVRDMLSTGKIPDGKTMLGLTLWIAETSARVCSSGAGDPAGCGRAGPTGVE